MRSSNINYHQIFIDILNKKYPHKKEECLPFLKKNTLSAAEIIEINKRIFGAIKENQLHNQNLKSYKKSDINKILEYQKKNHLNNSQLANHFKLSKNTITKWKKLSF
ncbi:helix-turn-helix domain-containing protein [Chryseobacterium sp. RR2-3-20]|uniref:helix-turn-helix domain-containing protein n=1 Tax=Chryseobacterium sp. RR2-3-20 TaxID=2787626 RepID=UPI001AE05511|nr:helix-turn-helix domain-containing protein [Chryseobacterium sp. RR2-3-20]